MSDSNIHDAERAKWGDLVDRLVGGVANLATDRLKLAALEARQAAGKMMFVAGLCAAAAVLGLIGLVFLGLGVVELLSRPDILGRIGAWLTVALLLLLGAGGLVAAAVWSTKSRATPETGASGGTSTVPPAPAID